MATRPASLYYLHRPLMAFGAAMAVLTVVGFVGLVVDDRTLVGAPIWAKPLKFALSFLLYAPTLAWLLSLLRRHHTAGRRAGTVVAVTAAVEMAIIVGQVIRGRQSHYNVLTTVDTVLWTAMGATIAVLWVANLVVAVLLLRERITDRATSSAVRLGLALAVAGMALGFLMTGPTPEQDAMMREGVATVVGAHNVGVPDGGPGLPLLGWSTTGGDLRIPHFVGMHGLQVLPLVALALLQLGRRVPRLRDDGTRRNLVRTVAAGYAGLVALVTWQALRGQPLTAPDAATLGAAGVLLLVTVGAAAAVLATARTPVPAATPALSGGTR
ncbi:hypothetical protein GA0074692_3767 [Micromonospora pallida]|uniref:Uncharacterized protein n=1 Tax=Micromonospora pallida TaxID=145854 RepID=A0A1C6SXD5_9ACTN|nr:hypothetical protein [Micromonospora pallida]SCL34187.1 hypothetical protein GA0074692_3767 [Micromonospora pallida]